MTMKKCIKICQTKKCHHFIVSALPKCFINILNLLGEFLNSTIIESLSSSTILIMLSTNCFLKPDWISDRIVVEFSKSTEIHDRITEYL